MEEQMAELEIIGAPMSNFVWSVRIACAEKDVPYKLVAVRPQSAEAKAASPTGKIPGMRHGDVVLSESKAIISYVDKAFKGKKMIPSKPQQLAEVEQWCSIVNTFIDPVIMRKYALAYFMPGTPDGKPDKARVAAAIPDLEKVYDMLETRLTDNRWLAAGRFSAADALLAPMLIYASKLPEGGKLMKKRKKLNSYMNRVRKRATVQATKPKD